MPFGRSVAGKDEEPVRCLVSMFSRALPGHTHTCKLDHSRNPKKPNDHFCPECHRWWFPPKKGECEMCGGAHASGACLL